MRVEEVEIAMMVDRFLRGRNPQPRLSCWEFECQAGRTYCAIDHKGAIHACGSDVTNHVLGHLDTGIEDAHMDSTLQRLHHKGDWVIRCFDCSARRICHHSCPTSDYNSEQFKEYDCRYTKLLYAHLEAHPEKRIASTRPAGPGTARRRAARSCRCRRCGW